VHRSVEGFIVLAGHWNFVALRAELAQLLEEFPQNEQPTSR
jgi:hypothetical protein